MKRNLLRLAVIAIAALSSLAVQGQLFRPMGLGDGLGKHIHSYYMPRMHVEGDSLFVCTNQGLYCKDLSDDASQWQLAGFEGIPLQDYVRNGNDMLALRHNVDSCFLLLSHDGGQTYQDITSTELIVNNPRVKNVLIRLVQHPEDPNTLLVLSKIWGMYRLTDFGRTWSKECGDTLALGTSIGFHPARPDIIYNSGSDDIEEPCINITYDGGQTWNIIFPFWNGDNAVFHIAFNPSNPDRWIIGGLGIVGTSDDNGHNWELQELDRQRTAAWNLTAFDNENSNIVYMAGSLSSEVKVMCSTDGGRSWLAPQTEPDQLYVNDMQQYGDKLLIYTGADVYEVSKSELLATSSIPAQHISSSADESSEVYDLQGRRTTHTGSGIYIKNGRKVMVQ